LWRVGKACKDRKEFLWSCFSEKLRSLLFESIEKKSIQTSSNETKPNKGDCSFQTREHQFRTDAAAGDQESKTDALEI
jgi:hypothetical protein